MNGRFGFTAGLLENCYGVRTSLSTDSQLSRISRANSLRSTYLTGDFNVAHQLTYQNFPGSASKKRIISLLRSTASPRGNARSDFLRVSEAVKTRKPVSTMFLWKIGCSGHPVWNRLTQNGLGRAHCGCFLADCVSFPEDFLYLDPGLAASSCFCGRLASLTASFHEPFG